MRSHLPIILHGVAVKKYASAAEIAALTGLDPAEVGRSLAGAVATERVSAHGDKYTLTPLAQVALRFDYSRQFAGVRSHGEFVQAYQRFEEINVELKSLITRWQTVEFHGAQVPNDHSDPDYDMEIIARLADLHDRADVLLACFETVIPRFTYYRTGLAAALAHSESGSPEWVSGTNVPSYHTLWFELHEDLLRILGKQRRED